MADETPVQNPLSLVVTLKPGVNPDDFQLNLVAAHTSQQTNILHFAWVIPLAPNKVLLSTVYDGDFDAYLDVFINANPEGFNAVLEGAVGTPNPPITDPANRAAFHEWVRKNNVAPLGKFFSAYPDMTVIKIHRCQQKS